MVTIKSEREIELMREAGEILAKVRRTGQDSKTGNLHQRDRPHL